MKHSTIKTNAPVLISARSELTQLCDAPNVVVDEPDASTTKSWSLHWLKYVDFNQHPPYFRYDTDDSTAKENDSVRQLIQEELAECGFTLVETYVEHDCITGDLVPVWSQENNT